MDTNVFIGSMINNYEILERIGHGGMGDVYLAKHPQIGKKVAIKILRPESSKNPKIVQRFFHEAKVVDEIHHQNVVDVLDFGQTPEGECYIIMEYLDGEPLSSLIMGEGPLSLELIGHIGLQICSALAAAHSKGVIHRDLKSDNVFLVERDSSDNFVKIFDFGIAKLLDDTPKMLTTDGITMGTPVYMSPEQAMGRPINGQTDIYALGVLLYYMATKTYPFFDTNPVVVANMQVSAPLPLPSERHPSIDRLLEAVIVRCLEKEQALRYGSMQDVATALGFACGIDSANYFGKKRVVNSSEFNVSSININPTPRGISSAAPSPAPKEPSLVMMSSEVIASTQPTARKFPFWIASLFMGFMGLGLFVLFSGESLSTSIGEVDVPDLQALIRSASKSPASAPNEELREEATSLPTNAEVPVGTHQKISAPSKKSSKQRPSTLKKFQWFFAKKNKTN
jgi:serine/threonine protein kinase